MIPDAFPTFIWLHKEAMLSRIDSLIEAKASDSALTAAERAPIIADLDSKIRDLEFEEGALISSIEKFGRFQHRAPARNVG